MAPPAASPRRASLVLAAATAAALLLATAPPARAFEQTLSTWTPVPPKMKAFELECYAAWLSQSIPGVAVDVSDPLAPTLRLPTRAALAAALPASPSAATCSACGRAGACPLAASLLNSFYFSYGTPAAMEECVPGGVSNAQLAFRVSESYDDGVYRLVDATGATVELELTWCKVQLSKAGLQLAIILPLGFVFVFLPLLACMSHFLCRDSANAAEAAKASGAGKNGSDDNGGGNVSPRAVRTVPPTKQQAQVEESAELEGPAAAAEV
jgi:hypothetical protein